MTGRLAWIALFVALLAAGARAQAPAPAPPESPPPPEHAHEPAAGSEAEPAEEVATDSPRSAIKRFVEYTRADMYVDAARFLDLDAHDHERGPELARRLKDVLDRYVALDPSRISAESSGDENDRLPAGVDEICTIPNPGGDPEPVRMVRRGNHEERWQFSRATIGNIDRWYEQLDHRFVLEHAPHWLLKTGPRGIPLWQWFAIGALFACAWIFGWIVGHGVVAVLRPLARRTPLTWDNVLLERMRTPLVIAFMLLLVAVLTPGLGLLRAAQEFVDDLRRGGLLAVFFLALARSVDVGAEVLTSSPWAREHSGSYSLIPLGARVAKLFVLALAAVALLSVLGYPVASLLAGLGIGGLAIALAAQKTVENLFGAFSIGADQPFRVGDFVKVEDFLGNVEAVGLRSTRIRTLDRTLITVPNGKLAEMRIESYAARDRLRLQSVLGLTYDTTAAQLQEVVAGFERVLREHPQVLPDSISVFFQAFGDTSLRIEATAYFKTADFKQFQGYRQDVLLRFMAVVEQAGTSFATPPRTLQLAGGDAPQAAPKQTP